MKDLDFVDYLQVVSILVALILATFPVFIDIKTTDQFNWKAYVLGALFIVALFLAALATISKSIEDKRNYTSIIENSNAILKRVDTNLNSTLEIQQRTASLLTKVDQNLTATLQMDKDRKEAYRNRARASFNSISSSYTEVMFAAVRSQKFTPEEEKERLQKAKNFVLRTLTTLNSELDNPILLKNMDALKIWTDCINEMNVIQNTINGYGTAPDIYNIEKSLDDAIRHLMQHLPDVYMKNGHDLFEDK